MLSIMWFLFIEKHKFTHKLAMNLKFETIRLPKNFLLLVMVVRLVAEQVCNRGSKWHID